MTNETLHIIESVAREFLGKLGADGGIRVASKQEGEVMVDVNLQEPQLFIGEKGQTLFEIAHILKALVRRRVAEPVRVILDINDYQKNKEQYLRELARSAADEVALFKKDKELPAMTPGERRVVHLELAERQDVVSESVGEGPDRRVVIKVRPPMDLDSSGGSVPDL